MMAGRKIVDLTGNRYFRLVVLGRGGKVGRGGYAWLCKCDCGVTKIIRGSNLVSGSTVSCGCYNLQKASETLTTHGESGTRLYKIWIKMKERCNNPSNIKYSNYGGSGISVCSLWESDFIPFMEWAKENGYRENLTLDRIDNSKGYCPENCRWATYKQQANNKRNNVTVCIGGASHTLSEWADLYGINSRTAATRYYRGDVGADIFRPAKR